MYEPLTCEDCGGTCVDPGSLHEPEECQSCQGSGMQLVETDTRSSNFLARKPMGHALPMIPTIGEIEERRGQYGD